MKPRISSFLFLVASEQAVLAAYSWNRCKDTVQKIQRGELAIGSINHETIDEYIYPGKIYGLNPSFPRNQYLAITYAGKVSTSVVSLSCD